MAMTRDFKCESEVFNGPKCTVQCSRCAPSRKRGTKGLSRSELVSQAFECCEQTVLSYGPSTVAQVDRDNMVRTMQHFKSLALHSIAQEEKDDG